MNWAQKIIVGIVVFGICYMIYLVGYTNGNRDGAKGINKHPGEDS